MSYPAHKLEQIIKLGLKSGELAVLTGDWDVLQGLGISAVDIVSGIVEIVGPTGTLVVPQYDRADWVLRDIGFQENEYAAALRNMPGSIVNEHPTHPFVGLGRLAPLLFEGTRSVSPFGRDSVPFRMLQANARQVMLFAGLSESPFVYLAESVSGLAYTERSVRVPIKLASGKTVRKFMQMPGCSNNFRELEDASFINCSSDNTICTAIARDIFNRAKAELREDASALLCEQPDCDICAQSHAIMDATLADNQDKQIAAFAEEEEGTRQELERRFEGNVNFYETDRNSINRN